jgi:aryl-alcohol dehydrogenase-like predicted oxidoreductase
MVGLGCNNFGGDRIDRDASRKVLHKALDMGITLIDTADTYGNRGGRTLLELAMSWLASQPLVASIIAGATTAEQVALNARAVEWSSCADELSAIDAAIGQGSAAAA